MWETGARQVAEAQEQGQALEALDRLERHQVGPVRERHAAGCRRALRALALQQVMGCQSEVAEGRDFDVLARGH